MRNLLVMVLPARVPLRGTCVSPRATKGPGFKRVWEGVGVDGSSQWMWITTYDGVHEPLVCDGACSSSSGARGEEPACLGVPGARFFHMDTLTMGCGVVKCLRRDDPPIQIRNWTGSLEPGADGTLQDGNDIWERGHARPDRMIDPPAVPAPPPAPQPSVFLQRRLPCVFVFGGGLRRSGNRLLCLVRRPPRVRTWLGQSCRRWAIAGHAHDGCRGGFDDV
jgi:hypothetical protein